MKIFAYDSNDGLDMMNVLKAMNSGQKSSVNKGTKAMFDFSKLVIKGSFEFRKKW